MCCQEPPAGISKAAALFALAKQSKSLGAFKVARVAYEKLQKLKVGNMGKMTN